MNRTKLKNYAPQARRDFIQALTDRAAYFGLTANKIEPVVEKGDVAVIGGQSHPRAIARKRKQLEERIKHHGFEQTMEALAYTWFNRLVAIRFMELHDYLEHGYRVLSHPVGKPTPEILEHAEHVDLPGLKKETAIDLKLAGNKEAELYRLLLTAQCNALHAAMPFLFERIDDGTELLLPDNLLHSDSLIRKLVNEIDEEDWQEVEIIGWLYEAYISERYEAVIGKVVASEDIPAATQRFTPKWIVKYLVQNTLGRQWLATYPQSVLRQQTQYYVEPAEQTPEVQEQLKAITPASLHPEELTLLDPACGSGHILVEAYDVFKAIYQERGYRAKDIPALILQKNLFGLEIDDRAAQLAAFALMMKARADDRRIFESEAKPNIVALQNGLPLAQLKESIPEDSSDYKDFAYLHATYRDAKVFGSLIQPVYKPGVLHEHFENELKLRVLEDLFISDVATQTMNLLRQHKLLARHYDAVVANPPYMGSKYFDGTLKELVAKNYKEAKADLYACFIQRNLAFAKPNGFVGMITIPNWMFLSSFEGLRRSLFAKQTIDSFIHNGRGVFGSDFGSCSFILRNYSLPTYRGVFRRLFDKQGSVATNEELEAKFFTADNHLASPDDFRKIPGGVIAYWISERERLAFAESVALSKTALPRQGLATADDGRFLRMWHEVSLSDVGFACESKQRAVTSGKKWFPFLKGGAFRKWHGNEEYVIDWEKDGERIKAFRPRAVVRNEDAYFQEGITWSLISISSPSFRRFDRGFVIGHKGPGIFASDGNVSVVLAFLNSCVVTSFLAVLSPAVGFEIGQIQDLPYRTPGSRAGELAQELVQVHREDWDSSEVSWNFQHQPLLDGSRYPTVEKAFSMWENACLVRIAKARELEEENNFLFIHAFDLQGELSPKVPESQITLYRPDRTEDIKRLLAYAIGCMMGRYSLDKPGLIYAHSGNRGFDASQYKTFRADDDGIIPLLETDWGIRDDAANRLVEFIGVAWPKEHLEENLKFIADSLGTTGNEQPRDTIRRYLATGFYKHHLSMYKKRPIYWLFSSGKQRAFQCLVYLHRYHEGTLARMRTEYVIPLQGQITGRIEQLEGDKTKATSTSHRKKLQKEQDDLKKQQAELLNFEEKLKHTADKKIGLDLDDGVKVNYSKFSHPKYGEILAEVKAVTGGKDDE